MTVQEKSAREYGSQGQQRSCVLALKLAEAALLAEALGEKPVILLDDVMSELDASRQDYLLNKIQGWQVVYHPAAIPTPFRACPRAEPFT